MSNPLNDFVLGSGYPKGLGYFDGDDEAVNSASTISKSQRRKFKRYGQVPTAFFLYLKRTGIIRTDEPIPNNRSIETLLDLLYEKGDSGGQYLREKILKSMYPDLRSSFISSDRIWDGMEDKIRVWGKKPNDHRLTQTVYNKKR